MEITKCPLCDDANIRSNREPLVDEFAVDCPACGKYGISFEALDQVASMADRCPVSFATRQATEKRGRLVLCSSDLDQYVEALVSITWRLQQREVLDLLRKRSQFFGEWVSFHPTKDWPLIMARGKEEGWNLVNALAKKGFVEKEAGGEIWRLTEAGWDVVDPIGGGEAGTVFIAMSFDKTLEDVFDNGILPAVKQCGLRPVRTDREVFSDKICDRILLELRRAELVVADFTLNNCGVYFEAGYARALGRTVISTCRQDCLGQVHFDTQPVSASGVDRPR